MQAGGCGGLGGHLADHFARRDHVRQLLDG